MTKANTQVIAKVAAVVAGLGLVLSSFALAIPASAQTTTFTRDLTIGATGADVTALQTWLISKGFSIPAGATGYFGTQTQAAVAAYQAANGITPPAGYFGPITRAKVNAGGPVMGGDDDDDDDDDSDNDDDTLDGGEADLNSFEFTDEESEGAENEEGVDIGTVEFDVEDGDVRVERAEFEFEPSNLSLEDNAWDFFETLYLLDGDGEELGEIDASDRDEWDEDDDVYTIVFTGLDHIVSEDDTAELTLAADIASNLDTADLAQDFTVNVADDGVRARDGEGIDHYIGDDTETVTFGFEEEETGDLDINSSSDDPDNMTIVSDEDNESDEYTVFVFELENNDDVDVLVTDLTIDVATSSSDSIASLLEDAYIMVDGEEIDGDIEANGTIVFEDADFVVGGDETVDVELVVTAAEDADGTVEFSIAAADIEAESDEDGEESDVSGSASSEQHTIALTGVSVEGISDESDSNDDGTTGTFEITFEITAEGDEDVYIYSGANQGDNDATPFSGMASSTGFAYNIISSSGVIAATTTDSGLVTSGAESDTDDDGVTYYIIESGETEEFTLSVSLSPQETGQFYVELDALRFGDEEDQDTADDTTYVVPDESEFQTSPESLS